jgi:hypothetical protein
MRCLIFSLYSDYAVRNVEWPDGSGGASSEDGWSLAQLERVNLVDEPACEPEDHAHNGHSGCKGAKKGAQRSQKAVAELPGQGMGPLQGLQAGLDVGAKQGQDLVRANDIQGGKATLPP